MGGDNHGDRTALVRRWVDYTIHGLSGHHTLAERPAHTHRRGGPASGIDAVSLAYFSFGKTGAANARAGKVVRLNVSPEFEDVTHWKKSDEGKEKSNETHFVEQLCM